MNLDKAIREVDGIRKTINAELEVFMSCIDNDQDINRVLYEHLCQVSANLQLALAGLKSAAQHVQTS